MLFFASACDVPQFCSAGDYNDCGTAASAVHLCVHTPPFHPGGTPGSPSPAAKGWLTRHPQGFDAHNQYCSGTVPVVCDANLYEDSAFLVQVSGVPGLSEVPGLFFDEGTTHMYVDILEMESGSFNSEAWPAGAKVETSNMPVLDFLANNPSEQVRDLFEYAEDDSSVDFTSASLAAYGLSEAYNEPTVSRFFDGKSFASAQDIFFSLNKWSLQLSQCWVIIGCPSLLPQ